MTCVHMFVHMVKHTHRRYSPIFSCVIIWIPFTWPEEQLKSTRSDRSEGLPWQQGSVMDTLQYWHSHIHTYTHSPSNLASTQQINFKNIKSVCEYIFNLLPQCTKHISSQTLRYRWQHNGSMPITHLSAQFRLLWKLQCQGYFRSASTRACTHTQASGDDCELVLKHLSSATIGSS